MDAGKTLFDTRVLSTLHRIYYKIYMLREFQ